MTDGNDIEVVVKRDTQGNILIVLQDLEGNWLAGATSPPELWFILKGALAAAERQMERRGWIGADAIYEPESLPAEDSCRWS